MFIVAYQSPCFSPYQVVLICLVTRVLVALQHCTMRPAWKLGGKRKGRSWEGKGTDGVRVGGKGRKR